MSLRVNAPVRIWTRRCVTCRVKFEVHSRKPSTKIYCESCSARRNLLAARARSVRKRAERMRESKRLSVSDTRDRCMRLAFKKYGSPETIAFDLVCGESDIRGYENVCKYVNSVEAYIKLMK